MRPQALALLLPLLGVGSPASGEPIDLTGFRPGTPEEAGGIRLAFDLGTRRTGWTNARWSVVRFDAPRDWSASGGLKIRVATAQPRRDAGVYVALLEADGSWYCLPWAVELTRAENEGVARFADFSTADFIAPPKAGPDAKEGWFDENGRFDPGAIVGLAIGCVNPLGVGKVEFTVLGIEPVGAMGAPAPGVAEVKVDGRFLDVNGTATVPAGLFGSFNLPKGHTARYRLAQDRRIFHEGLGGEPSYGDATTHMMIQTIGDRVRPSNRLTHPDWEARNRAFGERFGDAAKAAARGLTTYVEYWNEPYLNWANRNRANFNPAFFDEAGAKEGGEVRIKHDGQVAPHLRWTKDFRVPLWAWCSPQEWRRGRDAAGKVPSTYAPPYKGMEGIYGGKWNPATFPPEGVKDGEKFTARDGARDLELTAFTPWHIHDETQFSYWSGKGMLKFYIEPMLAFGKALKSRHPETVFIAGWGNRPSEDHWAGFTQLYQETIDRGIAIVDGVCDHDYGGDPFKMAANYEFITAYGMAKHRKWLYGFNTETAMGSDPQAYPESEVAKGALADRQKCAWTLAKLVHALAVVPDKARSFAWFGYGGGWFSDSGEGIALDLLANLRGRLLQVESGDPEVFAVAAIDGSDPLNPRPERLGPGPELVVAVLNAGSSEREVRLALRVPAPGPAGEARLRRIVHAGPGGSPAIDEAGVRPGDSGVFVLKLAGREAVTLTVPMRGVPPVDLKQTVQRRQFFAGEFLKAVGPDAPFAARIAVEPGVVAKAGRAWVRIVVERLAEGEGVLVFNGKEIPLPAAVTPENAPWVRDIPLDAALIKADNRVEFRVSDPARAGFALASASLVVESH